MNSQLLRGIPKVDELLKDRALLSRCENAPAQIVTNAIRQTLSALRQGVLENAVTALPDREILYDQIAALVSQSRLPSLRRVINGTGIVLHTNLGRACLSDSAAQAAASAARQYSTLEYDVTSGQRGLRYTHVERLLCQLSGAESAMVVNNNAAAVLLILSALAAGGEVITSRGELVEIGGSFRIPEIMESCGALLREVGTTNKTHLSDYAHAIGENTRALMKVHTSNYRIVGFTESVPLDALVALGHEKGLPVIEDLGSGCLVELAQYGICGEPTVQDSVRAGVDVLSFSGDKLLGGPQAGIIVGRKAILDQLKRHPLTRALRVDKMTLAALEATLRSYADGTAAQEIPTLAMLGMDIEALRIRAAALCTRLIAGGVRAEVVPEQGQVGGGSVPTQQLSTFSVAVQPASGSVDALEEAMRLREPPIIGRIAHDRYLLDVRTLQEEDFPSIAQALMETAL